MNQFRQKNSNLRMNALIVPNAAYIMKDYLPLGAPVRDQGEDMNYIKSSFPGDRPD